MDLCLEKGAEVGLQRTLGNMKQLNKLVLRWALEHYSESIHFTGYYEPGDCLFLALKNVNLTVLSIKNAHVRETEIINILKCQKTMEFLTIRPSSPERSLITKCQFARILSYICQFNRVLKIIDLGYLTEKSMTFSGREQVVTAFALMRQWMPLFFLDKLRNELGTITLVHGQFSARHQDNGNRYDLYKFSSCSTLPHFEWYDQQQCL